MLSLTQLGPPVITFIKLKYNIKMKLLINMLYFVANLITSRIVVKLSIIFARNTYLTLYNSAVISFKVSSIPWASCSLSTFCYVITFHTKWGRYCYILITVFFFNYYPLLEFILGEYPVFLTKWFKIPCSMVIFHHFDAYYHLLDFVVRIR